MFKNLFLLVLFFSGVGMFTFFSVYFFSESIDCEIARTNINNYSIFSQGFSGSIILDDFSSISGHLQNQMNEVVDNMVILGEDKFLENTGFFLGCSDSIVKYGVDTGSWLFLDTNGMSFSYFHIISDTDIEIRSKLKNIIEKKMENLDFGYDLISIEVTIDQIIVSFAINKDFYELTLLLKNGVFIESKIQIIYDQKSIKELELLNNYQKDIAKKG